MTKLRIHALTVCVDYADRLAPGIELWRNDLESWTIVTDFEDDETARLARHYGLALFQTDAFRRNGAYLNKGYAQEEAWPLIPREDWLLLLDADVIPPADWKHQLEVADLEAGYLYGCWRYDERGRKIPDDTHGYGYFQLFSAFDPLSEIKPFFDTFWTHAGNGDSTILLRWRDCGKLAPPLPLKLIHPGGADHNWYGRGNAGAFREMERERLRRGGGWIALEGEKIILR
jgi:hypothetical protein